MNVFKRKMYVLCESGKQSIKTFSDVFHHLNRKCVVRCVKECISLFRILLFFFSVGVLYDRNTGIRALENMQSKVFIAANQIE